MTILSFSMTRPFLSQHRSLTPKLDHGFARCKLRPSRSEATVWGQMTHPTSLMGSRSISGDTYTFKPCSLKEYLPSLTTLLSAAFVMLVSPVVQELIPPVIRDYFFAIFRRRFTFIIKEKCHLDRSDSTKCLEASKTFRQKKPTFDIAMGEEVVRESYLTDIIRRSEAKKKEEKMLKLYGRESGRLDGREWGSVNREHPTPFEKLGMDSELKKMVKDDLDSFIRRKELYKNVGKAWKRGYLIYGPPGTGKSSSIAAVANYLKFNIDDLNLSGKVSDLQWRNFAFNL
uniref:ATPase AAA-type core domain-containing protein n=1 Tax=Quercus lobata TaxID=97700 RepID=A0A7N2MWU6_QUELO